ncbi:MAG: hypothetical protein ACREJN_21250 [Nitrospiraceae bacterium]
MLPVTPTVGKGGGKNKVVGDMAIGGGKPAKAKTMGSMPKTMKGKGARKKA